MSSINKKTKAEKAEKLVERDGPVCYLCGRFVMFPYNMLHLNAFLIFTCHNVYRRMPRGKKVRICRRATFDHVIPRAKGGTQVLENLKIACQPCNVKKGNS